MLFPHELATLRICITSLGVMGRFCVGREQSISDRCPGRGSKQGSSRIEETRGES